MPAPVDIRLDGVVVVAAPVSDSDGVVWVIIRLDGVVVADDSGMVDRVVALGDVAVVPVVA